MPSEWLDMKSTHVLQPYTRQLAREIQEYARQCGFNLVPLNKIASQLEMAAARLEVSVRRGDHH